MSKQQVRTMRGISLGIITVAAVVGILSAAALTSSSCRTGVKPDSFVGAVVDCSANAGVVQATTQIVACLSSAGGPTGTAVLACLSDIANGLSATMADVTCVIARLAQSQATYGADTDTAPLAADLARQFLAANHVTVSGQGR